MNYFEHQDIPKSSSNKIYAGTCEFCLQRYRGLEEKDGKIICPECKTSQKKK